MSINSYLLSKLTNNLPKGADVYSLIQRYQALWTIYCNFLVVSALVVWKLCNQSYLPSTGDIAMVVSFPSITMSLAFLKQGKIGIAAELALVSIHIANFASGYYSSIGASHFEVLLPGLGFLLSSKSYVHILNFICCLLQNARHMYRMQEKFQVTLTEEQQNEIIQVHIVSFISLASIAVMFHIQNTNKNNLWKMAQTNFLKTEEIAKELVQAAKAKDIFVSSLSHEIRNPLNCMNGSIDYLLQIIKDPTHLQLLNNAKMSGEVLLNLLSNVLDAAKLKSDKMELLYTEANITETIKKVLVLFCENLREKKMKVNVYMDRGLPLIMWTDPSRLLQIVINLFSNAFKFSKEGGKIDLFMSWVPENQSKEGLLKSIEPSVQVHTDQTMPSRLETDNSRGQHFDGDTSLEEFLPTNSDIRPSCLKIFSESMEKAPGSVFFKDGSSGSKRFLAYNIEDYIAANTLQSVFSDLSPTFIRNESCKKGFLKIQVSDNGCGINQENIPKLFGMFSQADNVSNSTHTGSGLGLWICKQLCNKMGGDITLYSTVDVGTTFVLYVPVDNDSLSLEFQLRPRRVQECLRALVVDDYPYNRDMHKLILEREGIQVSLASDGKQALDIVTSHEEDYFQFIMMDVNMPVMDGFMAAKKIREWESERRRKRVDIYFVSGEYYDEEDVMRELKQGEGMAEIDGISCLKKPIDVEQIKKLLGKFKTDEDAEKT